MFSSKTSMGSWKIRDEKNTSTRDEIISQTGRTATIHVADLANQESVKRIIPTIARAGRGMDILLNCAGVQRRHPSESFPDDDWDEPTIARFPHRTLQNTLPSSTTVTSFSVLQVNLTSVFTLCREFGAYLLSRDAASFQSGRRGTIINVASLLSFQGGITVPAYAASKGGVAQLTKALSNEWMSKGISVNAIAPGYINTDMNTELMDNPERNSAILARIPAGRWGIPDDFKGVVVFLASEASSYVSGEIICVDGGWMGR
ncbi:2-deoxy-D-gluconate 3-dehydrogenase [Histoplasma capsulatum G186AR]|uniref:2-deoxy-D-gluconate 3-dehydrogenase n=1 Tax=Ajellomyces capsulatus (strain G186AR / H82 / ATCC MYA-2454 / RMSCC 2432) TaxID=447093 RepID=C0NET4_AJECG|nr:2-deoxy-D-gluconate 3-dehydrogenase [Histoplasma capsulatum G186AR]EEH09755.1 2-deoxy-D-gluconate 3-dehydrogenase [Histoplasma capsulatum G186AR]